MTFPDPVIADTAPPIPPLTRVPQDHDGKTATDPQVGDSRRGVPVADKTRRGSQDPSKIGRLREPCSLSRPSFLRCDAGREEEEAGGLRGGEVQPCGLPEWSKEQDIESRSTPSTASLASRQPSLSCMHPPSDLLTQRERVLDCQPTGLMSVPAVARADPPFPQRALSGQGGGWRSQGGVSRSQQPAPEMIESPRPSNGAPAQNDQRSSLAPAQSDPAQRSLQVALRKTTETNRGCDFSFFKEPRVVFEQMAQTPP